MTIPHTNPHPLETEPDNTSGEDSEHNYRYQHAYGAILLIDSECNKLPYIAIYAEHHEDLLCERLDNKFDCYQVKTRDPGEGDWDLNDEPVKKSIKRFVELNIKFQDHICAFFFVSNSGYSKPGMAIQDQTKLRRSPIRFMEIVRNCASLADVSKPFDETIEDLRNYCGCTSEELFSALQKLWFIQGPERYGYPSIITDKHLPQIDECSSFPIPIVNAIREELIRLVWVAASEVDDPSKDWYPIGWTSPENPHIRAKRVPVKVVMETVLQKSIPMFRFTGTSTLKLGDGAKNLAVLRKKMIKGGLQSQVDSMEQRSLSAEQRLFELAYINTDEIELYLQQLEWVVRGECDEAYLKATKNDGSIDGQLMLTDVYSRLQKKAEQDRILVYRQPKEMLIGIAGLLSGACKIWWSEPFELDGAE
jgi:hypothetical protein